MKSILGRFKPRSFQLLRSSYSREDFAADAMSGATVGLIALPLALALGVASMPPGVTGPYPAPAVGLFTAIIAGFLISLFGGTKVQIGGPTAAFVPVILLIIDKHGYGGLMLATIMAGVILMLMGFARLGSLIKYIPYPVTSGFTTGIAITLMLSQAPSFLGIRADEVAPRELWERVPWLLKHIPHVNPLAAFIAIGSAALIYLWPRMGWRRIPGSIVALILATLAVSILGFEKAYGVATVGSSFGPDAIPRGFPPLTMPEISLERIRDLVAPATTIALLGAIESLLSAVVADSLVNDRHDANTELVAQGIANVVCPFFCGLPATGAIARTSANIRCGARTPMAGLIHSVTLLLIILVFARYAQFVPMGAIAAVLIMVAYRMGEWHELGRLRQMPRSDAIVLVTTLVLTVVFDLVIAVEVGMVLAAILFIRRMAETTQVSLVTPNDELETQEQVAHGKDIPEGVLVYRIFGPFFFGAAEKMEDALQRVDRLPRVLILRMQLVPAMDATALNALESVVERMHASGGVVILSGPHRQPLEMLAKAGFIERIGRANIRAHFDDALTRAKDVLRTQHGRRDERGTVFPQAAS